MKKPLVLQLASLTCSAEARFKIGVDRTESRRETVPDLRIFDGFGYRGPDHKAAARAAVTRKINGQRRFVSKHQRFVQGPVVGESLARRGQADLPITRERLSRHIERGGNRLP